MVGGAAAPGESHGLPPLNCPLCGMGWAWERPISVSPRRNLVFTIRIQSNYAKYLCCHSDFPLLVPPAGVLFTLLLGRLVGISEILLLFHRVDRLMPAGPDTHRPAQSLWRGPFQSNPSQSTNLTGISGTAW